MSCSIVIVASFLINFGKQCFCITDRVTGNCIKEFRIRLILRHISIDFHSPFITKYSLHGSSGNLEKFCSISLCRYHLIAGPFQLLVEMFYTLFGGFSLYTSEPGDTLLTAGCL